jgi:hypothetical protein
MDPRMATGEVSAGAGEPIHATAIRPEPHRPPTVPMPAIKDMTTATQRARPVQTKRLVSWRATERSSASYMRCRMIRDSGQIHPRLERSEIVPASESLQ